jgi:predicted aspartyl protease
VLNLDNHSPTWLNNNAIAGNTAIKKSTHFLYSTTTAEGKSIKGDVYICDSIRMESLTFKNIALYNIATPENDSRPDGVIGDNIMREGVWKIDFKNLRLQFASSYDSIEGWQEADLLPASFTEDAIEINVQFSNGIRHTLELDLGYNGFIIVPAEVFASVTGSNKKIQKDSMLFSTPADASIVETSMAADSIETGGRRLGTLISTNPMVKENLLGLQFFSRFAFIILDYPRQRIYVSKERTTGPKQEE